MKWMIPVFILINFLIPSSIIRAEGFEESETETEASEQESQEQEKPRQERKEEPGDEIAAKLSSPEERERLYGLEELDPHRYGQKKDISDYLGTLFRLLSDDPVEAVRVKTADLLQACVMKHLHDEKIQPKILKAAKNDKSAKVRHTALRALLFLHGEDVLQQLLDSAKDSDGGVRLEAVKRLHGKRSYMVNAKLWGFMEHEVTPALIETLQDKDSTIRIASIEALADIFGNSKIKIAALRERMNNAQEEPLIRGKAAETAAKISSVYAKDLIPDYVKALDPEREEKEEFLQGVRKALMTIVGTTDAKKAMERYKADLRPAVRKPSQPDAKKMNSFDGRK